MTKELHGMKGTPPQRIWVHLVPFLFAAVASGAACTTGYIQFWTCEDPCEECADDLPAHWDGSCIATAPIDMPQSFSIEATTVTSCAPLVEAPPNTEVAWRTLAKACSSSLVLKPCADIGKLCAPPSGEPLEDSQQCIIYRGADLPCPLGYGERQVVYGAVGDITCSPCTCLPTEERVCEAAIQPYVDATCTQGAGYVPASLDMERCWPFTNVSGQVSSMDAVFTVNQPGTCAPQGGQMIGGGVPVQPATFCCM